MCNRVHLESRRRLAACPDIRWILVSLNLYNRGGGCKVNKNHRATVATFLGNAAGWNKLELSLKSMKLQEQGTGLQRVMIPQVGNVPRGEPETTMRMNSDHKPAHRVKIKRSVNNSGLVLCTNSEWNETASPFITACQLKCFLKAQVTQPCAAIVNLQALTPRCWWMRIYRGNYIAI